MENQFARTVAIVVVMGLILSVGAVGNAAAEPGELVTKVAEAASECVHVATDPPDVDVDPLNCLPDG